MSDEQQKIKKLENEIEDLKKQIQQETDDRQWAAGEVYRLLRMPGCSSEYWYLRPTQRFEVENR